MWFFLPSSLLFLKRFEKRKVPVMKKQVLMQKMTIRNLQMKKAMVNFIQSLIY